MADQLVDWDQVPLGEVPDHQLALQLGVSKQRISQVRHARGIQPAPKAKRHKPGPLKRYTDDQLREAGIGERSDEELATELGLHPGTVAQRRVALGLLRTEPQDRGQAEIVRTVYARGVVHLRVDEWLDVKPGDKVRVRREKGRIEILPPEE